KDIKRHFIEEDTKMAVQIMTGVINNNLGLIWLYLFLTQSAILEQRHLPITLLSGYPFWSSLCFIFSGTFTVVVEKKRSRFLMTYAIVMNIFSACLSLIGIWLLVFELSVFRTFSNSPWPQVSTRFL
uniref:Uncharacterized protein n=1 Tax=Sciurus vulgaris TaxID=55149 RepID=A0A8D2CS81_SCIVU